MKQTTIKPQQLTMAVVTAVLMGSLGATAATRNDSELLDDDAYRQPIEEIIVIGEAPQWRLDEPPAWQQDKFELRDASELPQPRLQWFPEYSRNERDNYDGIRNRMDEEAGIPIFRWRF